MVSETETIPNEMILASAGSGKTYQLTNRYIALMGLELLSGNTVRPERIVAVTFTRKAAGEFFDSILKKLAKAASSPQEAGKLCPPESDPLFLVMNQLGQPEYRRLLRVFIDRMPRLFLNTLDSFFSNVLRAFPAEFGLAGDFEIIDDHLAAVARQQVYRSVFQRSPIGKNEAQEEFLEAFRQATFGREESRIRGVLDRFVENQHEVYLHAASGEKWGNAKAIWPKGTRWLGVKRNLKEDFRRLFEIFSSEGELADGQWIFWEEFRDSSLSHTPGANLPRRIDYFLERILPNWAALEAGELTIVVNRKKQIVIDEACDLLSYIVTHLVGQEIETRLKRTHGIWEILSRYEKTYSQLVRRRGRLTFQDMELILAGHEFGGDHPQPILSQMPGFDDRMRIDYRLDAQYDHWLLDEFQDTNYVQWRVIQNLIDEAVQDVSEERSLFQVGDVKQAIYAWRGGDTRLFHDIFEHYKGDGTAPRIQPRDLNVSWRSGYDVIETVNKIFEPVPTFKALEIPKAAENRWHWKAHDVAPPNQKLPGHVAWMTPVCDTRDRDEVEEARFAAVVAILENMKPIERGIDCAILVQTNKVGRKLVDYVRTHSPSKIPVMSEADISIATDNPFNLALLSLLKFAAHPGDSFAWQHLAMTPFGGVFENEDLTRGHVASRVLTQVFDKGFEFCLREWIAELERAGFEFSAFARRRSEDLALAARMFDQTGSRDFDEFIGYAERFTVREPDTKSAVQVMTIHKSKGLTFDAVILPDLEGNKLSQIRKDIGVKRGRDREVKWVFDMPSTKMVEADPVLRNYREDREAEAAYEELCKFYVALTRASQANYLITSPVAKTSKSNNFVKLLELSLAGGSRNRRSLGHGAEVNFLYESETSATDPDWAEKHEPKESVSESTTETGSLVKTKRPRLRRRTPSGSEKQVVSAAQLFSRSGHFARDYGTLVHELFEKIDWLDEFDRAEFGETECEDAGLLAKAISEVTGCLETAEVQTELRRPAGEAECWRERRFEIVIDNEWLSGTFDRVVIMPGKSATILDFKTDWIEFDDDEKLESKIETYRPQLRSYRDVLSRMIQIPVEKITTKLVFTKLKRVVEIPIEQG